MSADLRQAVQDLIAAVERILDTEIVPGSEATKAAFRELLDAVRGAREVVREPGAPDPVPRRP